MNQNLVKLVFLSTLFLYGNLAFSEVSKLKCVLNGESLNEIGTWKLADKNGLRMHELNFGTRKACEQWTKGTNGDFFCSTVLHGPHGIRSVIASYSQRKVMAVLPYQSSTNLECASNFSSRKIVDQRVCIKTAFDWKIVDLNRGSRLSLTYSSAEQCEDDLNRKDLLKFYEYNEENYHGREIGKNFLYLPSYMGSMSGKQIVGSDFVEIYLGSPENCTANHEKAWCPNPKIKVPQGTTINFVGQKMKFLRMAFLKAWFHQPNYSAEIIELLPGQFSHNGMAYSHGFILFQNNSQNF